MKEKQLTTQADTCSVCGTPDISIFMEIPHVPVYCNVLWAKTEAAINAPRADIQLGFCQECGHIFNTAFDAGRVDYTQDYENTLHFSPRFNDYAQHLAHYLIDKYDLQGKDIIEIACGKGDFLRLLCDLGDNRGIGFDPSFEPGRDLIEENDNITFIQDYYTQQYSSYKGDLICCRHALEHIQFPKEFLEGIRGSIGSQSNTILFFEVPNVLFTLKDLGIWDLLYEHCSYFSSSSLLHVFNLSGFEVIDVRETFEGQYLCIEARPGENGDAAKHRQMDDIDELKGLVLAFQENYHDKVRAWKQKLKEMRREGQRLVIWGGGTKGITFSNVLNTEGLIEYIVDINSNKHWKYVPGTGQKIVPPQFLKEYKPDVIIVMNPVYLKEINKITKEMNVNAKIIAA